MIYVVIRKRIAAAALLLCLLCSLLTGCTAYDKKEAENTLTINMWADAVPQILGALQTKFPDIHFVVNEYAGANSSYYHKELLRHGQGGDIFFYTTFYNNSDAAEYLVDLSGYPFLANYDRALLSTLDVDGAIYQIPGPISVRYVAVNKTLFEEKGWEIPQTFDEVVAVCKQIRQEAPEIVPLGLGMEGMGFVWSLVTSYAQMGYLDTAEGQAAAQRYRQGKASFLDAFEEGLDMVGELVDAGAFEPEKFSRTWDVSPKQMGDREAAMCYIMSSNALHTKMFSGQGRGDPDFGAYEDEFVTLPLYGKNPKTHGLILGTTNTWGINKRLEEKGNEKKLENALRVLEYISSEEGQFAIRSDPATIPAIRNLRADAIPDFIKNLWNDSTNSIKCFFLYTGYEHIMVETGQILVDAMERRSSEGMKEAFVRVADQINDAYLRQTASAFSFGCAETDFSVEQTRKVSCEAFRAAAQADIAMASEGGLKNGVSNKSGLAGRLFAGNIVSESLTMIVASKSPRVVSVALTGREIREMLENGKILQGADGQTESFTYWAGGVEMEKKDGKITKITCGGAALEDDAVYQVAMLTDDYSADFAARHEVIDTGVDILDALSRYFKAQGTLRAQE